MLKIEKEPKKYQNIDYRPMNNMKIPTKFLRAGSNFLNHICRVLVKRHTAKAKNTRQIKGPRGLPKLFAVCFFGTAHGKYFCCVPYGLAHA